MTHLCKIMMINNKDTKIKWIVFKNNKWYKNLTIKNFNNHTNWGTKTIIFIVKITQEILWKRIRIIQQKRLSHVRKLRNQTVIQNQVEWQAWGTTKTCSTMILITGQHFNNKDHLINHIIIREKFSTQIK